MTRWVALLYSVVLSPTRRVTSESLMTLARQIGVSPIRTVLSSGNLILDADADEADLAARFEAAVAESWAKTMPVLLRTAEEWKALAAASPFPDLTAQDPTKVAVRVMRHQLDPSILPKITQLNGSEDQIALSPRAIWLASSVQLSTTPNLRLLSSPKVGIGTWRNASAVRKIAAALD